MKHYERVKFMTILENFIAGGWQKKAPAQEDERPYIFDNKVKNNIVNNQESLNNFDVLQKYKSGEYLHRVGALEFAPANDVLMATSLEPVPQSLWGDGLIIENEITILFSDTNTGKSVLAVQIGNDIAKTGKVVLYIDFELSRPQFRGRYTNDNGEDYEFSPNFMRCNVGQYSSYDEETIINDIMLACADSGTEVIIIDNLTWLESHVEKGEAAIHLMRKLIEMKNSHGLTVIPISHTTKRLLNQSLTINDLSGSSKIGQLIDAAITIAKSTKDPNLRFIKQLKVRTGSFKYNSDNVLVCELSKGKNNNFLHFEPIRTAHEAELLQPIDDETRDALIVRVRELTAKGWGKRAIAKELGISETTVLNYRKRLTNENDYK